jgi:amidohydrolase
MDILEIVELLKEEVYSIYSHLHSIPEKSWEEQKTSEFIKRKLDEAGFEVKSNINNTTGIIATLKGREKGIVYAVRADMDALMFNINGEETAVHACGHDANSTMALAAAIAIAKKGIKKGTLKMVFQPAEEVLGGAEAMLESGLLSDVDEMVGIHLRPIQEAKLYEATPALSHGASGFMNATIKGLNSHGARPHLGINAIDAGAAVVNAINAIKLNPSVPYSVKTTKFIAGGSAPNVIPDKAEMVFDMRAQTNEAMEELIEKTKQAIINGAKTVGAEVEVEHRGGVPGAAHDAEVVDRTKKAIEKVLGKSMDPIITPGGEDFHYYSTKGNIKTAYIGLGADLTPGLHNVDMDYNKDAILIGVKIIAEAVDSRLNSKFV